MMAESYQPIPSCAEWLTWCDHQLRKQALDQLTHDLEAHDMMARAYLDHPHPTQRHYFQHVGNERVSCTG